MGKRKGRKSCGTERGERLHGVRGKGNGHKPPGSGEPGVAEEPEGWCDNRRERNAVYDSDSEDRPIR